VVADLAHSRHWTQVSDLPGRLRVRCHGLNPVGEPASNRLDSTLLHHCRLTLSSCHWLRGFRINPLAGSICLHYPPQHRRDLKTLLERALTPPLPGSGLDLADPEQSLFAPGRPLIRHGLSCASILLIDAITPLPLTLLLGLSPLLLWPRINAALRQLRQGRLDVETLELGFSTAMLLEGLPRETLTDLGIHDATGAVQGVMQPKEDVVDGDRLLARLGRVVQLQPPDSAADPIPLAEAKPGQHYLIHGQQLCPLRSTLVSGRLLVSNRRINGHWHPRWLKRGEVIPTGSLVIRGQGTLELSEALSSDPTYALLHEQHDRSRIETGVLDRRLQRLSDWMSPLLLAGGGVMLARGSGEIALAALRFSPLHNWSDSVTASRLTAVADLALHKVRIRNPNVLSSLGRIRHLVVTQSCLNQAGGMRLKEETAPGADPTNGELLRLLAGIQSWLSGIDGMAIWTRQLQEIETPTAITSVAIEAEGHRYSVRTRAGDNVVIEAERPDDLLTPLRVSRHGDCIGRIVLQFLPDDHWLEAAEMLDRLGIRLHVVSSLPDDQLETCTEGLQLPDDQRHGACDAEARLALIRRLQGNGSNGVAYMGYLLQDLAALEQADVSMGMTTPDDSLMVARLCDLMIPTNASWLPRLVTMSRRLQQAETGNFSLITGSQIATALITASGWIAPMQAILFYDLPMLLAELNNILCVQTAGYAASGHPVPSRNKRQDAR
jgi:hypothetical protein